MNYKIIQTLPNDTNFHLFETLPKLIYPKDSQRFNIPDSISQEYLHTCLVLLENDKPKARLAIYNNPHLQYKSMKASCIGYYECIDDEMIAKRIISSAIEEAKKIGVQYIIGPMNGSTWESYRFSQDNNFPNFFLEPYNHIYYNQHFTETGFEKIAHYTSNLDRTLANNHPKVLARESELINAGVTFRNISIENFEAELNGIYDFNMRSFAHNFLFTPISKESFVNKYKKILPFVNPEFVIIAEKENQVVGFIFCFDDFCNRIEKSLIVKTFARDVRPEFKGLGNILGNKITDLAKDKNYTSMIHAFIHIENFASQHLSEEYSSERYKSYALYGMKLEN